MAECCDVLVVDDEESICDVYGRILDMDRYTYHVCTCGQAAVDLMEAGHRYSLALVDFVMPGLDGLETARRLVAIDPTIRIVFITGTLDVEHLTEQEFPAEVLLKPFTPQNLRGLIRRMRRALAA